MPHSFRFSHAGKGGYMALSKTERLVSDMAAPIAEGVGCYIYDVEFVKEGSAWYLRVYADREEGGISLDECEEISRALSTELDKADPISQNYFLEVSSPGIERRLREPAHFERYIGSLVDVGLYKPIDGEKYITACLSGYADGVITLRRDDGSEIKVNQSDTSSVKLHFEF